MFTRSFQVTYAYKYASALGGELEDAKDENNVEAKHTTRSISAISHDLCGLFNSLRGRDLWMHSEQFIARRVL